MAARPLPPTDLTELKTRALSIAGFSLAALSEQYDFPLPEDPKREKGWVGQLIEHCLGTSAGNEALPDFVELGVELKTLPLNAQKQPAESTYVTVVPLLNMHGLTWQDSVVYHKLRHVLWVPYEADKTIPFSERRIGAPIFWQPDTKISAVLQQDWEMFAELITLGRIEEITARQGEYLQIRPKGANAKQLCEAIGSDGAKIKTMPRGFYLRTALTKQVLMYLCTD